MAFCEQRTSLPRRPTPSATHSSCFSAELKTLTVSMNNNDTYSYILWRGTNFVDEKGGKSPPQCLKSFPAAHVWLWVKMELPLCPSRPPRSYPVPVTAGWGHCSPGPAFAAITSLFGNQHPGLWRDSSVFCNSPCLAGVPAAFNAHTVTVFMRLH